METKSQGRYLKKTEKKPKKTFLFTILVLVFAVLVTIVLILMRTSDVSLSNTDDSNTTQEYSQTDLSVLNKKHITTEQMNVVMQNETEGTVQIKVRIPDYLQLFQAAIQAENPDLYISEALINGEITLIETEVSAKVTVENGAQVVHEEEAIKKLMEAELTKAITIIMEEQ